MPAASRIDAENEYALIRKRFHDATHNCFAYQIGLDSKAEFRYSDDGEPNGTAGRPIYDAILSHKLTNVLVVVTRYFGGIKLGTGGLARAYRQTADQVLSGATVFEKLILQSFQITFEHDFTSVVMKTLADFDLRPLDTDYAESVKIHSAIRMSRFAEFEAALRDRAHGKVSIQREGELNA